jgi:hypothetical protein
MLRMSDKLNFISKLSSFKICIPKRHAVAFYASKCRIDFYNSKEIVKKILLFFTI